MNAILDMKAPLSAGPFLKISNNLGDVADAATSRTNLGLIAGGAGDIWVEKAGDVMIGTLTVDVNSVTALLVEQNGVHDNTLVVNTGGGGVGIGTNSPDTKLQIGDGANAIGLSGSGNTLFVGPDNIIGRIIVEGSTQADILFINSGEAANDKTMQLRNSGGITFFRSLSDVAGVQTDNILVMDHGNGNVGIGTNAPSTNLHIRKSAASAGVFVETALNTSFARFRILSAATFFLEHFQFGSTAAGTDTIGVANAGLALMYCGTGTVNMAIRTSNASANILFGAGTGAEDMRLDSNGNVGIGTTSPQGQFHTYESISGFILWEFDGLDATVRTIIPNGTGDVLYRLTAMYVLRDSAAAVASGTTDVSNSASVNLTVGGNTVRLRVNADGSTDIARTAGTDTIKVALALRWL